MRKRKTIQAIPKAFCVTWKRNKSNQTARAFVIPHDQITTYAQRGILRMVDSFS